MDEDIKRIFRANVKRLARNGDTCSGVSKSAVSLAICEITVLYSEICDIPYDKAALELHGGDNNED